MLATVLRQLLIPTDDEEQANYVPLRRLVELDLTSFPISLLSARCAGMGPRVRGLPPTFADIFRDLLKKRREAEPVSFKVLLRQYSDRMTSYEQDIQGLLQQLEQIDWSRASSSWSADYGDEA